MKNSVNVKSKAFYPRDAMLARSLRQRRICPSARLSHALAERKQDRDSWARTRGAQLTAGYTVNTYSKPPVYYSRRCRASPAVLTHAGRATHGTHTRAWRPSAAVARTDRLTRDRHDLPTSQPDNRTGQQPFCQYPAVSWEISVKL